MLNTVDLVLCFILGCYREPKILTIREGYFERVELLLFRVTYLFWVMYSDVQVVNMTCEESPELLTPQRP